MELTVTGLYCYPVKSCGGTALERANFNRRGIEYDREWLVVDHAGKFLTQRELPKMCLIQPALADDYLVLNAPGMPELKIPMAEPDEDDFMIEATVWQNSASAIYEGRAAANWLSVFLGRECRLVRIDGDDGYFFDNAAELIIGEASLTDLNGRLDKILPMNRFRPNIVVAGCPPYAEDNWHSLRIGDVTLASVGPCARCVVTTVDQLTVAKGSEPLRTLATYRRSADGKSVTFGKYFRHTSGEEICIGQTLQIP